MARAFEELFAIAGRFQGHPDGRPHRHVDSVECGRRSRDSSSRPHPRFATRISLISSASLNAPNPRKLIMPGVRPLLDALASRDDVYLALLTGNYQKAARLKLEHFDLWRYFQCGAFADDAPDRNSLVPKALERIRARGRAGRFDRPTSWSIGDTPHDVACALAAGARADRRGDGPVQRGAAARQWR